MQTEKSQAEGKWIMPKTRFTGFPALSIDGRIGISRSASQIDVCLLFLPITLKFFEIVYHFFHYDILCRITTFYECHSVFFVVGNK